VCPYKTRDQSKSSGTFSQKDVRFNDNRTLRDLNAARVQAGTPGAPERDSQKEPQGNGAQDEIVVEESSRQEGNTQYLSFGAQTPGRERNYKDPGKEESKRGERHQTDQWVCPLLGHPYPLASSQPTPPAARQTPPAVKPTPPVKGVNKKSDQKDTVWLQREEQRAYKVAKRLIKWEEEAEIVKSRAPSVKEGERLFDRRLNGMFNVIQRYDRGTQAWRIPHSRFPPGATRANVSRTCWDFARQAGGPYQGHKPIRRQLP
jgi:hypothetical protein